MNLTSLRDYVNVEVVNTICSSHSSLKFMTFYTSKCRKDFMYMIIVLNETSFPLHQMREISILINIMNITFHCHLRVVDFIS